MFRLLLILLLILFVFFSIRYCYMLSVDISQCNFSFCFFLITVEVHLRSLEDVCHCHSPAGMCFRHLCFWLCGCEDRPCSATTEAACITCVFCGENHIPDCVSLVRKKLTSGKKLKNEEAHFRSVISLEQDPRAKLGLRIVLVLLLIIVVFLYIFFSVFFDLIHPGPLPVWLNGSTNVTEDMLHPLRMHGLVTIR